jgi:hypothetical protein
MVEEKKSKAEIWIWFTRVGALLGIVGFVLSLYQWSVAQKQIRINAAIDISKAYLHDTSLRDAQHLLERARPVPEYDADGLRERAFVDLNDYIAELENSGLIDGRYVAPRVKCDIRWIVKLARERGGMDKTTLNAKSYVERGHDSECPE